MQLSPEDMAAAEACGVTFLPATPAQVQRFAMQRKIFYAAGQPILATRGDGFYETVGTLQRVIEEGLQQQRDLAAWAQSEAAAAAGEPAASEPEPEPTPAVVTAAPDAEAAAAEAPPAERPEPRKRARRSRPAVTEADPWPFELAEAPSAEREPGSEPGPEPGPPALPEPAGPIAKAADSAGSRPHQPGQRWLTAGPARRGRAGKHWSQRQR